MNICVSINQNGKITNRAALDEINKLIKLQALKFQGKGRALHYIMF